MRIDDHITGILLTGLIFTPLIIVLLKLFGVSDIYYIIISIFIGLFWGGLFPDSDCDKSRIFKMKRDKKRIGYQKSYQEYKTKKNQQELHDSFLIIYSSILISLGYISKFIFYKPSLMIISLVNKKYLNDYEVTDEHRGISHSVLGISIATIIFLILFVAINLFFKILSFKYIIISTIAFFIGGNLHLLQDSISRSGIRWLFPFKEKRIFGNFSAFGKKDPRIKLLNGYLAGASVLNFVTLYFLMTSKFSNFLRISLIIILSFGSVIYISKIMFKKCDVKIEIPLKEEVNKTKKYTN